MACCTEWTKSRNSWYSLVSSLSNNFFWNSRLWKLSQIVKVLVPINSHVTLKHNFQGSQCTFSKGSLGLTHCRVNLYSFSYAVLFKLSSKFCSLVDPKFLGCILFCNHCRKCTNRFIGIFCFHSFCIYQTRLDELKYASQRCYLWLVYQRMLGPNTKLQFQSRKRFHSLEIACGTSKFSKEMFWLQELSQLWYW